MQRSDMSCFIGRWPFYKVPGETLEDLKKMHLKYGITGGYVSSLESIFYNDPMEAEEELAQILEEEEHYHHILTINPCLPAWRENLLRGVSEFHIAGVRIVPSVQRYALDSPEVAKLCEELRELRLPLFLTLRMVDERTEYLLYSQSISMESVCNFLSQQYGFPICLSQIKNNELASICNAVMARKDVFYDTSGLKYYNDPLKKLDELQMLSERLRYGSFYPLNCMKSTLLLIEKTRASQPACAQIFDPIVFEA